MNTLPKSLSFKMPAEATPLGFRPAPKNVILTVDRFAQALRLGRCPGGGTRQFRTGTGRDAGASWPLWLWQDHDTAHDRGL